MRRPASKPFTQQGGRPEDPDQLQDGYEIIAGCLETPGEESRAAAEGYYAEHRASTVRRFVRTVCLEGG
ncbi:hypothetical protein ACMHYB_24405 [Sorangium sp. So ce1128]